MNTKIFLLYTFKSIRLNNNKNIKKTFNNKKKITFYKPINKLLNENNYLTLFNWKRYAINMFYSKYPFLIFGLFWFIGSKTGKYIAQKYIFKKPEAKLFVISGLF